MCTLNTVRTRIMPGTHVLLILPDMRLVHQTDFSSMGTAAWCASTLSVSRTIKRKRQKKKKLEAFFFSLLSISDPPHSPYHHSPFSPIDPSSCIPPQGVLRPFITVAMATPQSSDSGPGHCSPPPSSPSSRLFMSSCPFFSSLPTLPPTQTPSCSLLKHGFRTKKITKSQRQVGHMMMGRPPQVLLLSSQTP